MHRGAPAHQRVRGAQKNSSAWAKAPPGETLALGIAATNLAELADRKSQLTGLVGRAAGSSWAGGSRIATTSAAAPGCCGPD